MLHQKSCYQWNSIILTVISVTQLAGCRDFAKIEQAEAQVGRIVADLDQRTTKTGVYVRVKDGEIKQNDPWGIPIQVSYAQGGMAETVQVRSAGPDRQFHTRDDIQRQGIAVNLKGVGEGIKKNAGEVAASTAKGLVKGTVEGIKESVKDTFRKKKRPQAPEPKDEPAE